MSESLTEKELERLSAAVSKEARWLTVVALVWMANTFSEKDAAARRKRR